MTDEKKIADEKLSEDELDNITGGTIAETAADSFDLYRRGIVEDVYVGSERTRRAINVMGYKYEDKGGLFKPNKYYDHKGNPVDRGQFWEDFDNQYQREVVPVADVIREKMAPLVEQPLTQKKLCPV
ncbi:MAG: hypothetical protein IJG33_12910 [Selenomonadaceae bacterium]|nr:hypothetical protein [Selenomonadaceae bacterium]